MYKIYEAYLLFIVEECADTVKFCGKFISSDDKQIV